MLQFNFPEAVGTFILHGTGTGNDTTEHHCSSVNVDASVQSFGTHSSFSVLKLKSSLSN